METQRPHVAQVTSRKLVRVLIGERQPGQSQGRLVLALLQDYKAEISAPLLAENARLRAEIERLKSD